MEWIQLAQDNVFSEYSNEPSSLIKSGELKWLKNNK
jgi:hypothetical protein